MLLCLLMKQENIMNEEIIGGDSLYDDSYREVQERLRKRSEESLRATWALQQSDTELRIVIADDQELVRSGFRLILSSYENLKIVGEASNGSEAVSLVRQLHPDVVLMDIRMPIMDGIEATAEITQDPSLECTKVLVLTTFDVDEYVYDALQAGASGFMLKDSEPDDIANAIKVVSVGDALIQPSITRRLVEAFVGSRSRKIYSKGSLDALTDREREILSFVAKGLSNDEIAEELVISPATVKTHLARVMAKMDVHDRAQLVVLAYENGLVVPGA